MKRSREAFLETPAPSVAAWTVKRNDLVESVDLPHFETAVIGCWVRAVSQQQQYAVCCVQGVARAPKSYPLLLSSGKTVTCRTLLLLKNPVTGATKPRLLSYVSNSPPTANEAAAATAAIADVSSAASSAIKALQSVNTMKNRQQRGRPALAGAKPWGSSRSHRVSVLLRSGVSAPTWPPSKDPADSTPSTSAAAASSRVREVDTGTDTSAYYKVCLDTGGQGGDVGLGPCRIPERWRGGFTYLLVATTPATPPIAASASASSAAVVTPQLALLECQARLGDMAEPEATAIRAIRDLFGQWADETELSSVVFDTAVIEHREVIQARSAEAEDDISSTLVQIAVPRYPVPSTTSSSVSSPAMAIATSTVDESKACPIAPTGPFGRSFVSGSHLFVVDLDVLVRCGAIGGGWGLAGGPIEAVRQLQQANDDAEPLLETAMDAKRGRDSVPPGRKHASSRVELVGEGAMLSLLPPTATAIAAAAVPRPVAASMEDDPSASASGDLPATILRIPVSVVRAMTPEQLAAPHWWREPRLAEACAAPAGLEPFHAIAASAPAPTSHRWAAPSLKHVLQAWQGASEPSFPQRRQRRIRLYHGTGPGLATRVVREGFRRPTCKLNIACLKALEQIGASKGSSTETAATSEAGGEEEPTILTTSDALPLTIPHGCDCQMMGFAVYLARKRKAFSYASRRAEPDEREGSAIGAVIECEVDLGRCRHAQRVPCACGCKKPYCDHFGTWYSQQGYDSVFVDDHSRPATSTAEWAVANPARVNPVAIILFQTA